MDKLIIISDLHFRSTDPYYSGLKKFCRWFLESNHNNKENDILFSWRWQSKRVLLKEQSGIKVTNEACIDSRRSDISLVTIRQERD